MPYKDKENLYRAQKRYRESVRARIFEYLKNKRCADCGESDPVVLEFDHIVRSSKFKTVAKMLSGHYSWRAVSKEIGKCEIRCANCHRRKTYAELQTFGIKAPVVKRI